MMEPKAVNIDAFKCVSWLDGESLRAPSPAPPSPASFTSLHQSCEQETYVAGIPYCSYSEVYKRAISAETKDGTGDKVQSRRRKKRHARLRSRSSPVRMDARQTHGARTPSVSTVWPQDVNSEAPLADDRVNWAIDGYSTLPPTAPAILSKTARARAPLCVSTALRVLPEPPTLHRLEVHKPKDSEWVYTMAQQLVVDLVNELLLEPALPCRTTSSDKNDIASEKYNGVGAILDSSEVWRRSTAVQAHLGAGFGAHRPRSMGMATKAKENTDVEDVTAGGTGVGSQTGEWYGGVRALRDSHVRLVLRQLRHVERLNRALDRAASAPPTAPPTFI